MQYWAGNFTGVIACIDKLRQHLIVEKEVIRVLFHWQLYRHLFGADGFVVKAQGALGELFRQAWV